MTCTRTLAGGPLVCTRLDPHDQQARGGHVYQSTSGVAHCPKEEL